MNEMPIPITAAREICDDPVTFSMDDAHILRSKIIGRCAKVERWLVEVIEPIEKPEMMLSKKLQQLEKILARQKGLFKKNDLVLSRIETFKPFAAFRSEITHSEMTIFVINHQPTVLFDNAANEKIYYLRKCLKLSSEEFKTVENDISLAANKLTTLKPTPPSSPPRQKPAAAAGP